jgi:hypothetical protein
MRIIPPTRNRLTISAGVATPASLRLAIAEAAETSVAELPNAYGISTWPIRSTLDSLAANCAARTAGSGAPTEGLGAGGGVAAGGSAGGGSAGGSEQAVPADSTARTAITTAGRLADRLADRLKARTRPIPSARVKRRKSRTGVVIGPAPSLHTSITRSRARTRWRS